MRAPLKTVLASWAPSINIIIIITIIIIIIIREVKENQCLTTASEIKSYQKHLQ